MQTTPQGIIAAGDLYMDFLDSDGNNTGFVLAGNCKKFAPKIETEVRENKANGRDTYGQTTETFSRITGNSLSMVFNRYDPSILAAAFHGTAADQTAAAGAYAANSVTAVHDKWVETGYTGLDTVTVKDQTDVTTYVEDTDYTVNKRTGMVKALSTGSIGDGDTLHVTGDTLAKTGSKVTAGTKAVVNVALRLDGTNLATGANVLVSVWQVQLRSETDFDFMGDEFPECVLSGTMVTPTGKSGPFEVV